MVVARTDLHDGSVRVFAYVDVLKNFIGFFGTSQVVFDLDGTNKDLVEDAMLQMVVVDVEETYLFDDDGEDVGD